MIGRVFVLFAILCTSVHSLPVTSGHLESEDVKVLKCIVEALADVLSRPRPLPVSQDCLLTLTNDDRLVAILRHQNFLKELQEIALGGQKTAHEDPPLQQRAEDSPDRSMLQSVGGPGERSILSQERRGSVEERGEERRGEEVQVVPEEERREESQKRGTKEKKVSEHGEKRDSTKTKSISENGERDEKRGGDKRGGEEREVSSLHSLKSEEKDKKRGEKREGEDKRGGDERGEKRSGLKLWSKRAKSTQVQKKSDDEAEIPHHSKEITNEEVNAERRSPEEEELQLLARSATEEEGSGNKKESEIESLATIESELESVAQKLHELSRADRGQQRA
ncbi:hypothetical protein NL108_005853 [Boleophthalmus pectinirostris]|nr:hypothetical protein NL108_005853 [Boleophthalmus pectinirostris]